MGIIIKQTIRGTIWSYLGVGIGFVTMSYLFPKHLSTDVVGLFGLLLAYSGIFGQLSSLGINGVTSRLFPYFRDEKNNHNGYLFVAFMVLLLGSIFFLIIYFLISPILIEANLEKSSLFSNYLYLLIPLTITTAVYGFLDTYNKLLYDAVFGVFLNDFFQRFLILLVTLLFVFGVLGLHELILAYAVSVCLKAVLIFCYLLSKKEVSFNPQLRFLNKELKVEMFSVASYSVLTGIGFIALSNVDRIIVNHLIDLSNTGVYTIAFFFGTLVIIPSRPLLKISGTIISEAWKRNDIDEIKDVYYKSCINQFIIGGILFIGIWANIDNIMMLLGPEYSDAKWVIFFIGIAYVFEMLTGANGQVISFSEHYRVMFVFVLLLLVLIVVGNFILIPTYGIVGASIATSVGIILNNLIRYLFVYKRFKLQPFNKNFLIVILLFLFAYGCSLLLPQIGLLADIVIRSSLITIVLTTLIYLSGVSPDMNRLFKDFFRKLFLVKL